MARAVASSGSETGGRGSGSKPMKTSGRPDASSRTPSSAAISVGGGRTAFRPRTAVDVWAASARRGTGPSASSPPASQMMSRAWAAPTNPPATRSAAPMTPVPSARATVRPMAEPIDSPRPTARSRPSRTTNGRMAGSRASSGSASNGRAAMASAPPPMAPSRPPTCGSAPERKPRRMASTMSRMATRSSGFTARMVAQVAESGRRSPGHAISAATAPQPTTTSMSGAPPVPSRSV